MVKEELLTVVVPVYNVEQYLKRCVNSILKQTYKNLQVLLIDDGSTDESGRICDEFSCDKRVEVIHKANGGLSSARNAGLEHVKGQYISFVDSDDYIDQDMYSEMMNALCNAEAEIAVCGRYDECERTCKINFALEKQRVFSDAEAMARMLSWDKMDISACDKVYKADLWKHIRFPVGRNNEDICVIPSIICLANRIVHIGQAKYHYCHRQASITATYNPKRIKDFYSAIQHIKTFSEEYYPEVTDALTYYLNSTCLSLLMMAERIGYKGEEREFAVIQLKKNWTNTFSRERMDFRRRILYLTLRLHLYRPLVAIKNKLKFGVLKFGKKE